jgi:hypothetical protein
MTFGLGKDKSNRDNLLNFLHKYDSKAGVSDKKNICGIDAWVINTNICHDTLQKILDVKVYIAYCLNASTIYIIKHSDMLSKYNKCDGFFDFDKRFDFKCAYKYCVVAEELENVMPNSTFNMNYESGLLYCAIDWKDDFEILKLMLHLKPKYYTMISADEYVINTNYLMVECE